MKYTVGELRKGLRGFHPKSEVFYSIGCGLRIVPYEAKPNGRPKLRDDNGIKTLRKQGLSYREIAQKLGCSLSMVQRGLGADWKSKKLRERGG